MLDKTVPTKVRLTWLIPPKKSFSGTLDLDTHILRDLKSSSSVVCDLCTSNPQHLSPTLVPVIDNMFITSVIQRIHGTHTIVTPPPFGICLKCQEALGI